MRRWIRWALVMAFVLGPLPIAPAAAQGGEDEFIARLLAQMPPEAKVGQLFLLTLPGAIARPDHPMRGLLAEQRIGGVILSPDQGNFANLGDTPSELLSITRSLQQQAADLSPFIPLFIGLRQSGGGPTASAWTAGAMPLPTPLALGATWDPERVYAVGQALGDELQAVGVNLLLGPPLDVLLEPRPEMGDAGAQTFGGDPQWVGRIARAYLSGLLAGSGGRVLAAPGSFPGEGRAYGREERTATLTKEDLAAFDLLPFLTLMRTSAEDGRPLLRAVQVSTMRIRGFGGSPQEWTRAPRAARDQSMAGERRRFDLPSPGASGDPRALHRRARGSGFPPRRPGCVHGGERSDLAGGPPPKPRRGGPTGDGGHRVLP